jgi:hypothetical protein
MIGDRLDQIWTKVVGRVEIWPSRPKAIICCRLSSLNTLLMAPEATLPPGDVNVPGDYFSLAGFEVTTYGRFWVIPEGKK